MAKKNTQNRSLVYYVALAGVVALGVVEWPVAAAVAIGHYLSTSDNKTVREVGEALEEA